MLLLTIETGFISLGDSVVNGKLWVLFNYSTCAIVAQVFDQCKKVLLQCATPESIVRYTHPTLTGDAVTISDTYFKRQTHDSLQQFLTKYIRIEEPGFGVFAQVLNIYNRNNNILGR